MRVREPRENAAFTAESFLAAASDERRIEKLDRGIPFEAAIAAPREPDAAHAALTDRGFDRVGANRLAGERRRPGMRRKGCVEEPLTVECRVLVEQGLNLVGEPRIGFPQSLEPRAALVPGQVHGLLEIRADRLPLAFCQRDHRGLLRVVGGDSLP